MRTIATGMIFLLLSTAPALGQAFSVPEFDFEDRMVEGWLDLTTIKDLDERWQYNGDYGARWAITKGSFALTYLRPSFRYRVKPWLTAHGGGQAVPVHSHDDPALICIIHAPRDTMARGKPSIPPATHREVGSARTGHHAGTLLAVPYHRHGDHLDRGR
jgi:hypothetical protein